jgi:hypothetical protein
VVLQITVSDTTPDGSTEQVALLEQIHVPNSP